MSSRSDSSGPLISVIIPAYNHGRYVAQAVESALRQSHPLVEVVVVDDGSIDETPDVLRAYGGEPQLTVIRQANAGLPSARNRGLREARGEFVCFLDSDSWLAATHAAQLSQPLIDDPSVGLAYCDVQMMDQSGQPSNGFSVVHARHVLSGDILPSLVIGGYFPTHAALSRRRLLNELGGFDPDLGGNADYDMWLRLCGAGHRAVFVNERLAWFRVHEGSLSRDLEHMRRTRIGALERTARRHPARMAAALSAVQDLAVDMHTANTWLKAKWDPAMAAAERTKGPAQWSLMAHIDEARLETGAADQLEVRNVAIDGPVEPSLLLHPPAVVEIVVPTGEAGRLTTAFAIDPEAWTQADAAACLFSIDVDNTVAVSALLDPARQPADRRWVSVTLDVPGSTDGRHVLTLETKTFGAPTFAWALFRDVRFSAA